MALLYCMKRKYLKSQKSQQVWPCPELQQQYEKGELVSQLALRPAHEGFKISYTLYTYT